MLKWKSVKLLFCFLLIGGCSLQREHNPPTETCTEALTANTTIAELKAIIGDSMTWISEDLIIKTLVVSSDQQGNFFNRLYLQDLNSATIHGVQLELDLRESHLWYPPGSWVWIQLRGLHATFKNGSLRVGSAVNSFGSVNLGRIPNLLVRDHLITSCEPMVEVVPLDIQIEQLQECHINTLIALDQLEFEQSSLGQTYAIAGEASSRLLVNCTGQEIWMFNSGFSDFQEDELPAGNGRIQGVLVKDGKDLGLKIRSPDDLIFDRERCEVLNPRVSSDSLFISEIADPDNESGARFIELYNGSTKKISLSGWTLRRHTNDSEEVSSEFSLNGRAVESGSTLVIAANDSVFQKIFGKEPDLVAGTNSVADSNGDDNIALYDPFGTLIDQFGVPGEDGSGTNHEFEDGGAFRKEEIQRASPDFMAKQWRIYNDTGAEGTIKQPLHAPEDYSPGVR